MAAQPIQVHEYRTRKAYERDAQRMARDGWEVVSTTERTARSGCMRVVFTGGLGAILWKPKPILVVTYRHMPPV